MSRFTACFPGSCVQSNVIYTAYTLKWNYMKLLSECPLALFDHTPNICYFFFTFQWHFLSIRFAGPRVTRQKIPSAVMPHRPGEVLESRVMSLGPCKPGTEPDWKFETNWILTVYWDMFRMLFFLISWLQYIIIVQRLNWSRIAWSISTNRTRKDGGGGGGAGGHSSSSSSSSSSPRAPIRTEGMAEAIWLSMSKQSVTSCARVKQEWCVSVSDFPLRGTDKKCKTHPLSGKSLGGLRQFICAAVCSARDIWDVSTELAHCGIIVFLCLHLLLTWLANLPKQQSWTRAGIMCQTVVWAQSKVAKRKAAGPQNYIYFSYFFCYYYSINDISFTPRFNLLAKAPKCSERLAMMFASGWHT